MPNVSLYNQTGEMKGELAFADRILAVTPDQGLIHEVMVALRANKRHAIANTKTRGEVSGGGKKPWKQKGTGRARQGSIRSPQWVGGGIVFGPTSERNFTTKINKKTKRKALFMALTDKLMSKELFALEAVDTSTPKTKVFVAMLTKLPVGRSVLLVAPAHQPMLVRMAKNLPNVTIVTPQSLGLLDVLTHRTVIFMKEAVPAFEQVYRA